MNAEEWVERSTKRFLHRSPRTPRKTVPVTIVEKRTGQTLMMRSGKRVWPSIGAAKNAIRNDVQYCGRAESDKLYNAVLELVAFVPVGREDGKLA